MSRKARTPPLTASWTASRAKRGGVRRKERAPSRSAIPAERAGRQPIPDEREDQPDEQADDRPDEHGVSRAAGGRLACHGAFDDPRLLDVFRLGDLLLRAHLVVDELRPLELEVVQLARQDQAV